MTQPLTPIQTLWLNTLVSNRDKLNGLKDLWTEVNIETHIGQVKNLADFVWREGKLDIRVTPMDRWAKIEQAEAMQYILARAFNILYERSGLFLDWPKEVTDDQQLFDYLRCCPTNDAQPDVRWRKIQMLHYRHNLPYSNLEDRPICGICHGRVATGAGAEGGCKYELGTCDAFKRFGKCLHDKPYRPDVHNECYRYAKLILVPALRLQREQAKLKQTAEVDK